MTSTTSKILAAFLLVATFGVGIVAGVVADRAVLIHQHRILPAHGLRIASNHVVRVLTRELDLDPAQRSGVEAIVERHRAGIERIWNGMRPEVRKELLAADHEIEQILRPGQKARFAELRKKWQARAGTMLERP